jgi:phosphoserine phosphatase
LTSNTYLQAIDRKLQGRRLEVFVFDMDGVIFEGHNFWLDLHIALGTKDEALDLAGRYMLSDYGRLAEITAGTLWKGRSAEPLLRLVRDRRYVDGMPELFHALNEARVITCIVSSGPYQLAQRAQADCDIHAIFANKVAIGDGRFTGTVNLGVDNNKKGEVLWRFLSSLDRDKPAVAVMGDTASDMDMFQYADLCIAYDSETEALLTKSDIGLRRGEMPRFAAALAQYLTSQTAGPRQPPP